MEREPLLPTTTLPISRRKQHLSAAAAAAAAAPSSPLCPLPEDGEIFLPFSSLHSPSSSSSSFKDRLIFGSSLSPPSSSIPDPYQIPETLTLTTSYSPPRSPTVTAPIPPGSDAAAADDPPLLSRATTHLHRSRTAPAMCPIDNVQSQPHHHHHASSPRRLSIVRQAILLLAVYLSLGVLIYTLNPAHFSATETHPVVDALYFCIVTMCTIGYGDITPVTPFAKLFSITFVIVGFGFVDILLSGMVSYVLDLQESLLLAAVKRPGWDRAHHHRKHNYLIDVKKGRMRIRMKVGLALGVVVICISIGTAVLCFVERLGWLDSFYLSVMSVTTVGYGDRAFKTLPGRLFASVWLLVSTLTVARAFLYLAEARIDKRHRKIAKLVLGRDMTISEFLAADIDNNGFVSKSEFVIYKLKEMGMITEKDILPICDQFDRIDSGNCGKIKLSNLVESHHHHDR